MTGRQAQVAFAPRSHGIFPRAIFFLCPERHSAAGAAAGGDEPEAAHGGFGCRIFHPFLFYAPIAFFFRVWRGDTVSTVEQAAFFRACGGAIGPSVIALFAFLRLENGVSTWQRRGGGDNDGGRQRFPTASSSYAFIDTGAWFARAGVPALRRAGAAAAVAIGRIPIIAALTRLLHAVAAYRGARAGSLARARVPAFDGARVAASVAIRRIAVVTPLAPYLERVAACRSAATTWCAATTPSTLNRTRTATAISAVSIPIIAAFRPFLCAVPTLLTDTGRGAVTGPSAFYDAYAGAPITIRAVIIITPFTGIHGAVCRSSCAVICFSVVAVGDAAFLAVVRLSARRPRNLDDHEHCRCREAKEGESSVNNVMLLQPIIVSLSSSQGNVI